MSLQDQALWFLEGLGDWSRILMTGKTQTSHPSSGKARGTVQQYKRLLTLTSVPGKIMEQIRLGATYRCSKNKKVMGNCQHTSVQDEPRLTHLTPFCVEMTGSVDKGRAACFDFTKAFDKIPHSILRAKPVKYSLNRLIVSWVENQLDNYWDQ